MMNGPYRMRIFSYEGKNIMPKHLLSVQLIFVKIILCAILLLISDIKDVAIDMDIVCCLHLYLPGESSMDKSIERPVSRSMDEPTDRQTF